MSTRLSRPVWSRFGASRLRRDLGLQLLALYVLFIGPVLVGALLFDRIIQRNLEEEVRAADLSLAQAIALETNATLTNAMRTVQSLASYPSVRVGDAEAMRVVFGDVLLARADVNLVYRLDANGVMQYHFPEGPSSTVGVDFSFREYFQAARASREPVFSDGRISPTTGSPVATAVMPLFDDAGAFRGIVATNLSLASLSETLKVIVGGAARGLIVSIVDARGQVIAHPFLLEADLAANPLLTVRQGEDLGLPENLLPDWGAWDDGAVPRVLAGETNSVIAIGPDGSEWLRSFVPISVAGWGVIVQRPTSVAFAAITRFHRLLLAAVGVYLLGGVFFWLALSRRVILPLEQLAEFSQLVGSRQGAPASARQTLAGWEARSDQIGHLARSLATMADNIERRFEELGTLLETSRRVVSSLDADQVIASILDEVQRLLKVERAAIVALDKRLGVFRITASRGLSEAYVEQLRIEPSEASSPAMLTLRTQTPVQIPDTETEPTYEALRQRARAEGFRAVLAAPLVTQHAPPAALILYRNLPHQFTEAEQELVASFANHAAMAMEHAALFARSDAQLQEQTSRLEAIVESLADGLVLESLEGGVLFCNQAAADLLGMRRSVARRQSARDLTAALLASALDEHEATARARAAFAGRGERIVDFQRRDGAGRTQDLRLRIFDVTDAEGQLIGRGQYWQDITRDKNLDRMKSALLGTVSHELRTPLASIKGFATTLLAQDVQWDAAAQREFVQIISQEADRLAVLVNNLLDLSRLEGGALQLRREAHPLEAVIRETMAQESRRLEARLHLNLPPDLPTVWIDRPRMETVLRNLLENAAKYSPIEAGVEVSAHKQDGQVVVRVRDYGPGVPTEQRQRVFDRFYQGEDDRRISGTGLGLAISKGFVEAHGGRIWVEDAGPGALFAFSLPLTSLEQEEATDDGAHPGRR